jgi:ABC-type lipoprotein release transport system permease subunit
MASSASARFLSYSTRRSSSSHRARSCCSAWSWLYAIGAAIGITVFIFVLLVLFDPKGGKGFR